jgi:hypothetical protein
MSSGGLATQNQVRRSDARRLDWWCVADDADDG